MANSLQHPTADDGGPGQQLLQPIQLGMYRCESLNLRAAPLHVAIAGQHCAAHNKHSRSARLRVPLRGDGDTTEEGNLNSAKGHGAQNEAHGDGNQRWRLAEASRTLLTLRPQLRCGLTRPVDVVTCTPVALQHCCDELLASANEKLR
jgi:hypothetical protein